MTAVIPIKGVEPLISAFNSIINGYKWAYYNSFINTEANPVEHRKVISKTASLAQAPGGCPY